MADLTLHSLLLILLLTHMVTPQSPSTLETYSLPEESPENTFVGDLSVHPDISTLQPAVVANMQYRLLRQGNDLAAYFSVQENDGVIQTAETFDRDVICPGESSCRVDLGIMASSPPDFYKHLTVGVNVLDVNDNTPEFQSPRIQRSIPESTGVGSSFSIPTAVDPDSPRYGIGQYRMISGGPEFRLKVTDSSGSVSLHLVLQESVDREQKEDYSCVIAVTDRGDSSKSGTLTVDINISDINDHAPEFEADTYSANVDEDADIFTLVTAVRALDMDSGLNGEIVYGFSTQTDSTALEVFHIDSSTGEITVAGPLDYEQRTEYTLVVTARDHSEQWLPSEAKVTITVNDVNDHPPQITVNDINGNNNISVPEDVRPGAFLAYIMVQDLDSGINGEADCSMLSDAFTVHQESLTAYSLHASSPLDRETTSRYTLQFVCRDRATLPLSSISLIAVSVQDVNDNDPEFTQTQYTAVLAENNDIGATVAKVQANDPDFGPNGQVSFSLDATSKLWLDIDPTGGIVTAKRPFDYEQFRNFSAQVTAFDRGDTPRSATTRLVIHLVDTNDQPPEFFQENYNLEVAENLGGDAMVGQVFAMDRDSAPFNTFKFSLQSTAGAFNPFYIDSSSGVIYTNAILDREFKDTYTLVAVATDDDDASLTGSTTVTISISDENDNDPRITFPGYTNDTIHISNLSPVGFVLPKIQAHDPDQGRNGTLVFSIVSGNDRQYFALDRESGVLSVQRSLSHVAMETVQIRVLVRDSGIQPRSVQGVLTISINKSIELPPGALGESTEGLDDDDDRLVSDNNLAIVIAVAVVSTVVIIILLVAIVIVRRQEKRRKQQKNMSRLLFDQRVTVSTQDGQGKDENMYSKNNSAEMGYNNDVEIADEQLKQQKQFNKATRSSTRSCSSARELRRPQQKDPIVLGPHLHYPLGQPHPHNLHPGAPPPWGYQASCPQMLPPGGHRHDHDALSANSDESAADSGRGSNDDGSSARSHADMDQSFSRGLNTSRNSYHGYSHQNRHPSHAPRSTSSRASRSPLTNQNQPKLHHQPHSRPHIHVAKPARPAPSYKRTRSEDNTDNTVYNHWDRQNVDKDSTCYSIDLPGLSSSKV